MARISKRIVKEYSTLAKENEALWALIWVLLMVIGMEFYVWL
jgi:hypothetical protein